jgi:hypothetical protein
MPQRKIRVLELARVGKWGLDNSEITRADICELKETFAGKRPVIIGHDTDRAPKFGDVLDCWPSADGNSLVGPVIFTETGDRLYEGNYYDGWSISMPRRTDDGKRVLHHLAILGAVPPKIPGLEELAQVAVNFGDDAEEDKYQFSGHIPEKESSEVDPLEEAKKALAEKEAKIAELEAQNKTLAEQAAQKAAAQTPAAEAKADAPAEAAPNNGAGDANYADMQKQIDGLKAGRRKERLESFAHNIAGKMPAGVAAKAKVLAGQIESAGEFDFSDNGKIEKRDALWLLGEILRGWPEPVRTGAAGVNYSDGADGSQPVDWAATAKKM